ncbi:LacI family DNA-binding transcriptional regulator [Streptomyces radicis]|uniref:LacI family transcriptional regulator n=1 Tax=Streptomyces radicis TaxID=1750517 RepID=A0A3A9WT53_9ACTN|nr:LacI family DNA-binding transcriptional regulator [Streptomyces radicis]RKN10956.1 LacI family transcriptional regulator [Streptomyces radicis]RKN25219.1 LacI family transcriptional regulator [Streptomyces radicis]
MAVTRDDVARAAGVSPAVVSYVINNGPRPVSAAAKERVLAAIAELGYQRDAMARYLRTRKTHSLGLVVPDLGQPYFGAITQHLSEQSFDSGHQLLVATTSWRPERERAQLASLAERRVDGVILMSTDPLQDFAPLQALGIPIVVVDRPEVAVEGARAATAHLIEHGHERIGLVGADGEHVAGRRQREGWAGALRDHGLEARPDDVFSAEATRSAGYAAAIALLDRADRPTALFATSDAQAVGVIRAARDRGVAIPEGLALVSGEGTDLTGFAVPRLTAVEQPVAAIAREALSAAFEADPGTVSRLDHHEFGLVRRESCGCHESIPADQ